jgi:hypothetical protein
MKNLFLSATIILGSLTAFASTSPISNTIIKTISIQEEYTEVASDAVPVAVKSTIEKSFPGTKLEKAYKNEKNEYKLEIASGNKKYTVFTDATGNIIKK